MELMLLPEGKYDTEWSATREHLFRDDEVLPVSYPPSSKHGRKFVPYSNSLSSPPQNFPGNCTRRDLPGKKFPGKWPVSVAARACTKRSRSETGHSPQIKKTHTEQGLCAIF